MDQASWTSEFVPLRLSLLDSADPFFRLQVLARGARHQRGDLVDRAAAPDISVSGYQVASHPSYGVAAGSMRILSFVPLCPSVLFRRPRCICTTSVPGSVFRSAAYPVRMCIALVTTLAMDSFRHVTGLAGASSPIKTPVQALSDMCIAFIPTEKPSDTIPEARPKQSARYTHPLLQASLTSPTPFPSPPPSPSSLRASPPPDSHCSASARAPHPPPASRGPPHSSPADARPCSAASRRRPRAGRRRPSLRPDWRRAARPRGCSGPAARCGTRPRRSRA